ncbi:heat shock protein transcriptional repressor HspR [Egicoccus sp. AB-alg2]|uniref:heat shock protein transcriptional repressor HspR n=1 Tax=Egicoccus sp. AB-alg2 TaxID=3242693 RepID=UPI00359E50E4
MATAPTSDEAPETTAGPEDAGGLAPQRFLEPHASANWSWSRRREDADPDPTARFRQTDDEDAPVYVISVAAELAGLHPQTLRAYEREGLLHPARTEGGTRRYSRRDVERLRFIRTLTQDEGLNLAGVRVVLDLGEKLEGARRRIGELEEMVRVLAARVDHRPAGERFEIVKAPSRDVEVHQLRRRTGQRPPASPPVQRARPVPPPDQRAAEG